MPDAPDPITSPPALPWQPWDTSDGGGDAQTDPTQIYNAAGSTSGAEPWVKIRGAGAIDMASGAVTGGWPGDGTSTNPWTQT